jgi:hypothetical protein
LEEQRDGIEKQLQLLMERENSVEADRVELMEQNAVLEDKERNLNEAEALIATTSCHVQSALIHNEAEKQQLIIEREHLNYERNNLEREIEAVQKAAVAAAASNAAALMPVAVEEKLKTQQQQKVRFSIQDAEGLNARVAAQKQEQYMMNFDDSNLLVDGEELLQLEDGDEQQEEVVLSYSKRIVCSSSRSPSSKKKPPVSGSRTRSMERFAMKRVIKEAKKSEEGTLEREDFRNKFLDGVKTRKQKEVALALADAARK